MSKWIIISTVLSILLLIFLLYKEYRRKNNKRLGWRLLATTFAILGFIGMAIPLNYNRSAMETAEESIILLTEGFNSDTLEILLNELKSNYKIYTIDKDVKTINRYQPVYVSSLSSLLKKEEKSYKLHVVGYGLSQDEIASLDQHNIDFHPSILPTGITTIHWPAKIKSGEKLQMQGTFNNSQSVPAKIVLTSFNTILDSILIPANKQQTFSFATIPRQSGRAVYSLAVVIKKDTIANEPVPFEVLQPAPLRVLILATAPDFENKFLKNWLGENGHIVVVKTATSLNKSDNSFLNAGNINANRITSSFLNNFDVIKTEASWLTTASKIESAMILSAVAANKIGLIISADSIAGSSFYAKRFALTRVAANAKQQLNPHLFDTSITLQLLPAENQLYINNSHNNQAVITDNNNKILVSSSLYGAGNMLLTTIPNTFNWYLSGHQTDYANYWTNILQKAAAKTTLDEAWSITPSLPEINKPALIQVQTNQPEITPANTGSSAIHLKNSEGLSYSWIGLYWPSNAGWQPTVKFDGEIFWWYAYERQHWNTTHAFDKMQATLQYAERNKHEITKPLKDVKKIPTKIPKIYFFVIILFASAYLWYEKKLTV